MSDGGRTTIRTNRRRRLRRALRSLVVALSVPVLLLLALRWRYGGGEPFPDRSGKPSLDASAIEQVAELRYPPGNIAVSKGGRVFFTFHPDGKPPVKLAEWVDGKAVPFPNREFQSEREGAWLDTPLGLRIDRQGRLWVLDNANHGSGDAKLLAFDIDKRELVREFHFPTSVAGLGSHLNDLQIHPDGKRIYIAEASIFAKKPALIVYDIERNKVRRLLEKHPSVRAENFYLTVGGEPQIVYGLFTIKPGVDSIALDRQGEWLYYAAVTAQQMYRIRTRDLDDESLDDAELGRRVEVFGELKTSSDGITIDDAGRLYITDPEHDAVVTMSRDGKLSTLLRDEQLRWPDGFSFGPGGWLYLTCSSLQHVIMQDAEHVAEHGPYLIVRFKAPGKGYPGH
jgi:sugar lactone lactonase YvrE